MANSEGAGAVGFVAEEGEVGDVVVRHDESVIVGEEGGLAVVSALCNMMGETGEDDAGDAWHGGGS